MIEPDFSQTPEAFQPGEYTCEIKGASDSANKTTGTRSIRWNLKVSDSGIHFAHTTPYTGPGAGMFKRFVHATGDDTYQSGPYDPEVLMGKFIKCSLVPEEYQGQVFIKCKRVEKVDVEQQ